MRQKIFHMIAIQLKKVSRDIEYEVILINDRSTDHTQQMIELAAITYENIGYIGHQVAIKAGIDYAKGDRTVTMDADLQHSPATINEMIHLFNIVIAIRKSTGKISWLKKSTSTLFYWLLSKLSNINIARYGADFRLIDRRITDII